MISDQARSYVQREDREWKYQKMSVVGGLACRFLRVQSSSQEQSIWGNNNREKRVCTVSVNQWATKDEKQMRRSVVSLRNTQYKGEQRCSEPSVVCLGDTEDSQKGESYNNQDVKEQKQKQVFVAFVDRRWRMELMWQTSKWAEHTRLETWVFMVKWQSNVAPWFLTESDKGTDAPPTVIVWEGKRERSGVSTREYDHCFSLVVI